MSIIDLRRNRVKGKDNRKIEKYSLYSEKFSERDGMAHPKILRVPMSHFDPSNVNQVYLRRSAKMHYSYFINPYWRPENSMYYYDEESIDNSEITDKRGKKKLPKQSVFSSQEWNPKKYASPSKDQKTILKLIQDLKPIPKKKNLSIELKSWIYYQIESVPIRCMKMLLFIRIVVQRKNVGNGSKGNVTLIAVSHRHRPNYWDVYSHRGYVGGVYRSPYNYWSISSSQRAGIRYFFCHQDAILELIEEYLEILAERIKR